MPLRVLRGKEIHVFFLVCVQSPSIIKHGGRNSFEAATVLFVISYFMSRGLGCYTETNCMGDKLGHLREASYFRKTR